jgi:MoaA/NifB/PqqE/SkfB family radical SAM enzyme
MKIARIIWSNFMQPKTSVKLGQDACQRILRSAGMKSKAARRRKQNSAYAAEIPQEIGIQLTYRCNLRCKHCFQWNEKGFFKEETKSVGKMDLDLEVIEKALNETRKNKANLYLWGGEPLVHRKWEDICKLLESDPRWTVLCTNGLLIEERLDSICRISPNLAMLVSIDGLGRHHDAIRGKGTFDRIIKNINLLLSLHKRGIYKGRVSVNCVINQHAVSHLYDFVSYFEKMEIDTVYLCFPWYIPERICKSMDKFVQSNFPQLKLDSKVRKPSWYSYSFHLDSEHLDILKAEINKLLSREWNIRIRLQPAVELNEIDDFISGTEHTAQNRSQCFAISNRMDILADGQVSSCKLFPEFSIGNLYSHGVIDIWNNEQFKDFRRVLSGGLMPVCSKCVLLYLSGQ